MAASGPALELDQVARHFERGARLVRALDGLDLRLAPGRLVGLVGANGAGKTTLLRTATGLLRPTAGRVRVLGVDLEREPGIVRRAIGQAGADERSFPPRLTALESLCDFAGLRGMDRREAAARARARAEQLDAADVLERPFQRLSSGQRRRVALIRALLHDPPLLLLDEPTRGLDPASARAVLALARAEARRGALVLVSSHDLADVEETCDELVVLERGRVVVHGHRHDVLPALAHPGWRARFADAGALAAARARFAGLEPTPDPAVARVDQDERGRFPAALAPLATSTDAGLVALERRERLTLEELLAAVRSGDAPVRATIEVRAPRAETVPSATSAVPEHGGLLRALATLVRRDAAIELSYRFKLGLHALLLVVWAVMFHYLSRMIRGDADLDAAVHGDPYGFLLLGFAALEISQVEMTHMGKALREEQLLGTLEPTLATGRAPLLLVLGSVLWRLLVTLVLMGLVVFLAGAGLGADLSRTSWPALAATTLVGCAAVVALGLVSAAFVHAFKRGDPVALAFNLVSLVAAGAYFPRELLPEGVRTFTALLPHTTALEAARAATLDGAGFGDPGFRTPFLALCASAALLAPLSVGVFALAHRRARTRGTIAEA